MSTEPTPDEEHTSYIVNCLVCPRGVPPDGAVISITAQGALQWIRLDGYAIVPLEQMADEARREQIGQNARDFIAKRPRPS